MLPGWLQNPVYVWYYKQDIKIMAGKAETQYSTPFIEILEVTKKKNGDETV